MLWGGAKSKKVMNKEVIARLFLLAYFCFVSLSSIGSLCDFIIPGFVVIVDLLASIFVSGAVVMPPRFLLVSYRVLICPFLLLRLVARS